MIIQIEIPKEFVEEYERDRFKEFFFRMVAGMEDNVLFGNYEMETAAMLTTAFEKSKIVE